MADFENPTRRYKWFRPRQAYQVNGFLSATNFGAIGLFNGSTGPKYLVVRGLRMCGFTADLEVYAQFIAGNPNPANSFALPFIPSNPAPSGVMWVNDFAVQPDITGYQFNHLKGSDAWWEHDFPFAVVEPGQSLAIVNSSSGADTSVAFVWEEVEADELDFLY